MNPYIIGPYSESDTGIFLGRTTEIDGMYRSFLQHDYLVCYANSGEGKSSIINAGLFPKLRRNKYFPINVRFLFNESDDLSKLDFDKIINDAINKELINCTLEPEVLFETSNDELITWQKDLINSYVWLRLRYSILKIKNGTNIENFIPVLVFDQFEEVFTNPRSEIWTKKFFKWLEELSTDVCPDIILKKLYERIDEDDFPLINSLKRFKAIFSLRSEYVGNIDYWGLQHYYIPDLKNNRYFLKPLTPKGAKEVIMQPYGIDITSEECDELICGCSENFDYVRENMPCVPASVLSIICHELCNHTKQQRTEILKLLHNDKNVAIDNILENYYLKLLRECGINDDKTRDAFEKALVDDKGNRKRIGTCHKDFGLITQEQIKKLKEHNLLRVISNASAEEGETVELPHDKFCGFIMNHKNKRFTEIEKKNANLKEWILFVVFAVIFGITALCIHSSIIDLLKPIILNSILSKNVDLFPELVKFIKCKPIFEGYHEGFIAFSSILLSALVLPILITSFTKKWIKCTILLAFFSVILSLLLSIKIDSFTDGSAGTLTLLVLIISLGIMIYSFNNREKKNESVISAWPLWMGYFLFSFYAFWEFTFSLIIGINEPGDSCFFIILLPVLLFRFSISYNSSLVELRSDKLGYIKISILIILLYLLAVNNGYSYLSDEKFDYIWVICILLGCIMLIINLLSKIADMPKRIFFITLNIISLISIYIINLGYNPLFIEYKSVAKVGSWRAIYVKNNISNLYGVCNPINGDTIIPCVLDTFDFYNNKGVIKSSKFKTNPVLGGKNVNYDSSFIWGQNSTVGKIWMGPVLEQYLSRQSKLYFKSLRTLEEKIDYQSATLFKEIRSVCIDYVCNAEPFSLDDVASFNILDSLQNIDFENQLRELSVNQKDTTISIDQHQRNKIEIMCDEDLKDFFSAITRNLFLYVLKDRILSKDFVSVLALATEYPLLYFTSIPQFPFHLIQNNDVNIIGFSNKFQEKFKLEIYSEDIEESKCFAWYDLFISLSLLDNGHNRENFNMHRFKSKLESIVEMLGNERERSDALMSNMKTEKDVVNALMGYLKLRDTQAKIREQILHSLDDFEYNNYKENEDLDLSFNDYCEKIYNTLYPIMEQNPKGIYNAAFENICNHLIITQMLRGYDVLDRINQLNNIDAAKKSYRDNLEKINSEVRNRVEELRKEVEELFVDYGK